MQKKLTGLGVAAVIAVSLILAVNSPYIQWRGPVYIMAGLAGIIGLCLLLVQPLLAINYFPAFPPVQSRKFHRLVGALLVVSVLIHVIGLWITSPPDVVDVLLFRSPTPFSNWGVVAMLMVFTTAFLALFRSALRLKPRTWRLLHLSLVLVIVVGTIVHALLIEGTMEPISKAVLCGLVLLTFLAAAANLLRKQKRN